MDQNDLLTEFHKLTASRGDLKEFRAHELNWLIKVLIEIKKNLENRVTCENFDKIRGQEPWSYKLKKTLETIDDLKFLGLADLMR